MNTDNKVLASEYHQKGNNDLKPIATNQPPKLRLLPNIKAAIFDIYGTLLISGSGDVGTLAQASKAEAFQDSFEETFRGQSWSADGYELEKRFFSAISESHNASKISGIDYPEVDIIDIWHTTLSGLVTPSPAVKDCKRIALSYETKVNPVCLMPRALQSLISLQSLGLDIGIVSNAQFFTQSFLEIELGRSLTDLGFTSELCSYSFACGYAKPSTQIFAPVTAALAERGLLPEHALYVGNDMLNDIFTASECGYRTCLFAGDLRSLRLRNDDPRCVEIQPDAVIDDLSQLPDILTG